MSHYNQMIISQARQSFVLLGGDVAVYNDSENTNLDALVIIDTDVLVSSDNGLSVVTSDVVSFLKVEVSKPERSGTVSIDGDLFTLSHKIFDDGFVVKMAARK